MSPKGAVGLMQLCRKPLGVTDPFDPVLFGVVLGLAAYNAGEGAVRRHGGIPPQHRETRQFITRVLGHHVTARMLRPVVSPAAASRRPEGHAAGIEFRRECISNLQRATPVKPGRLKPRRAKNR